MNIIEADTIATSAKVAVVVARFNKLINNNLLSGAIDILRRFGQVSSENITVVWVPGAYELPLIIQDLAISKKYDALIALGTIIRGITEHFKFIFDSCSYSLSKIAINNRIPIGLGLLTTDNMVQAIERSGIKGNNKGVESAFAVLEMINILKKINE